MNQILVVPKSKSILFFKIELVVSIIFLILCISYIAFYSNQNRDNTSLQMLDNYRIMQLYSSTNVPIDEKSYPPSPFVLGTISINSIGICYPIISDFSDELLALSICRFYGPLDSSVREFMFGWS